MFDLFRLSKIFDESPLLSDYLDSTTDEFNSIFVIGSIDDCALDVLANITLTAFLLGTIKRKEVHPV